MSHTRNCPSCGRSVTVSESDRGKAMRCPDCQTTLEEPPEEEPLLAEAAEAVTPHARPKPPPAPERRPMPRRVRQDEQDEEDEDDDYPRRDRWKPCPRCQCPHAQRVIWTFWGSFYGPAMFSHVRCDDCGYAYNGKTGRSNATVATIFVIIPLVLILLIFGGCGFGLFMLNR